MFWCTADIGWVTGHSYVVYGPLMNGATTLMFEGIPNYPDHDRFWRVVDKHRVNILYTAPTAIRALMREGDDYVTRHDLPSLRLLGSVEFGRASCRERVCQYGLISGFAVALKNKIAINSR